MQNNFQGKSYRILLQERLGRHFSEMEVTEILRQVLPKLAQIHTQGLIHGAISIDTLVQDQSSFQSILVDNPGVATAGYVAPEQLQTGQISAPGDIYALGVAIIVLLTGQSPEVLQNDDETWNWQNYCAVSDQLVAVVERAIAIQPQYRYANGMQMLQAINPSAAAVLPTQSQPDVVNSQSSHSLPAWQLVLIGSAAAVLMGVGGFGLANLLSPKPELQTNTSSATSQNNTLPGSTVATSTSTTSPEVSSQDPVKSQVSPKQILQDYYSNINNRQYEAGWNRLTTNFQNANPGKKGGFLEYLDWWESVRRVEIQQVYLISEFTTESVVDLDLKYFMKKGNVVSQSLRFVLVKDATTSNWLINKIIHK